MHHMQPTDAVLRQLEHCQKEIEKLKNELECLKEVKPLPKSEPCLDPLCSGQVELVALVTPRPIFAIRCEKCEMLGPLQQSHNDAWAAWYRCRRE